MNIMKLFKDKKVVIAGPCSFGTYEELKNKRIKCRYTSCGYF